MLERNETDGHHFFIYFLEMKVTRKYSKKKRNNIKRQDVICELQVNLLLFLYILSVVTFTQVL